MCSVDSLARYYTPHAASGVLHLPLATWDQVNVAVGDGLLGSVVVPSDRDIYRSRSYDKADTESRARYARLLAQGWCDAVRSLHPDAPMYSYWSLYRWPRDAGLRIDHLLLNKEVAPRLLAAGVDRDVRDTDNASDHALQPATSLIQS